MHGSYSRYRKYKWHTTPIEPLCIPFSLENSFLTRRLRWEFPNWAISWYHKMPHLWISFRPIDTDKWSRENWGKFCFVLPASRLETNFAVVPDQEQGKDCEKQNGGIKVPKKDEAAGWGYNTLPILTSRNIMVLFKMHVGGNRLRGAKCRPPDWIKKVGPLCGEPNFSF